MTSTAEADAAPRLVAFTAPTAQVIAILDAAERVRQRLLLASAMAGEQRARQLERLADEFRALDQALRDPALDGSLACLGSALALMAEAFRNSDPEIRGWCNNVLEVPPRRLARHLDALGDALFRSRGQPRPGSAYDPAMLDELVVRHLDRVRVARLRSSPLPRRRW
jgi:hypothetical protein